MPTTSGTAGPAHYTRSEQGSRQLGKARPSLIDLFDLRLIAVGLVVLLLILLLGVCDLLHREFTEAAVLHSE